MDYSQTTVSTSESQPAEVNPTNVPNSIREYRSQKSQRGVSMFQEPDTAKPWLERRVRELENRVGTISFYGDMESRLSRLERELGTFGGGDVESRITRAESGVRQYDDKIGGLERRVGGPSSGVGSLRERASHLNSNLGNGGSGIGTLDSLISATDIDQIEFQFRQLERQIGGGLGGNLTDRAEYLESQIGSSRYVGGDLSSRASGLSAGLDRLSGTIGKLESRVGGYSGYGDLYQKTTDLESKVGSYSGYGSSLNSRLDSVESNLTMPWTIRDRTDYMVGCPAGYNC